MSIVWLAPVAFAGLAALIAPIVIHLLTRQQRRRVPFPSLRFLQPTRLPALKRRLVDDWPLLLLRMAIVACAVSALAAPLVVTGARERAWASRMSRALVTGPSAPALDAERESAFAHATFPLGDRSADTLAAAVAWLDRQPPSAREIVVAGDLRTATITDADLEVVPDDVGLRFLPVAETEPVRDLAVPLLALREGVAVVASLDVHLGVSATRVRGEADRDKATVLSVRAAPADSAVADAALHAVIATRVLLDQHAERKLVVAWQGADLADLGPAVTPPTLSWIPAAIERLARPAQQHGDSLVVQLPARPVDEQAAIELREISEVVFADRRFDLEPQRLDADRLARWARPPAGPGPNQQPRDEGDRRWLWALALALLIVEQVWRRGGRVKAEQDMEEEARIA